MMKNNNSHAYNVSGHHWPLFQAFPKLIESIQPIQLCELPSPVLPLDKLGPHAWVKQDDAIHDVYGGNKIRKFEFIVPEIQKQKANHVYTFGGTGTNHGVATAVICKQLGLKASVITFHQPHSKHVQKNQELMQRFGANVMNAGSIYWALMKFYLNPRRFNKRNYFLPAGGATPVATFAYINAAFELKNQIENGLCPEPSEIYVAVGSSSTLAGLTLGCALAGLKTKVTGIQVFNSHIGPVETCTEGVTLSVMQKALTSIRQYYPNVSSDLPSVHLNGDFFGPGYGELTTETCEAIKRGESYGLALEQTYSGKAFDAFLKASKNTQHPILFWQTYNSQALP